jgi:chromosome segregation ATPase
VVEVLREVRRRLAERAKHQVSEAPELEKQLLKLRGDIKRLGEALLVADRPPEVVVKMIADREAQLTELQARLAVLKTAPSVIDMETRRLEREARGRLADLRGLLARNSTEARQALEAILEGPLVFTPVMTPKGKRYNITGKVAVGNLVVLEPDRTASVPSGI